MPNKGYFIQQMTRRDAGTLCCRTEYQDRATISTVKNFLRLVKSRLLSEVGSAASLSFTYSGSRTPSENAT